MPRKRRYSMKFRENRRDCGGQLSYKYRKNGRWIFARSNVNVTYKVRLSWCGCLSRDWQRRKWMTANVAGWEGRGMASGFLSFTARRAPGWPVACAQAGARRGDCVGAIKTIATDGHAR